MSGVGSKTPKSERKMELRLKNCHPMPDQCLYSSWLLKKGESGVSWKKRWFTLIEDKLLYYKRTTTIDTKGGPPGVLKGVIPITHKTELPEGKGKRSNDGHFTISVNGKDFLLRASDRNESIAWIVVLQDLIDKKIETENEKGKEEEGEEGKETEEIDQPTFGAKLCDVIEREKQGDYHVPFLLQLTMRWLEKHAYQIPGIFRLSGGHEEVRQLIEDLERGKLTEIPVGTDPHAVSGMFKQYLRALPDPIFPFNLYQAFLTVEQKLPDRDIKVQALIKLAQRLPKCHLWFLYQTFRMMQKFEDQAEITQMNVSNLAIVLSPNLFREPPQIDLVQSVKDTPFFLSLTKLMIEEYTSIFFDEHTYFRAQEESPSLLLPPPSSALPPSPSPPSSPSSSPAPAPAPAPSDSPSSPPLKEQSSTELQKIPLVHKNDDDDGAEEGAEKGGEGEGEKGEGENSDDNENVAEEKEKERGSSSKKEEKREEGKGEGDEEKEVENEDKKGIRDSFSSSCPALPGNTPPSSSPSPLSPPSSATSAPSKSAHPASPRSPTPPPLPPVENPPPKSPRPVPPPLPPPSSSPPHSPPSSPRTNPRPVRTRSPPAMRRKTKEEKKQKLKLSRTVSAGGGFGGKGKVRKEERRLRKEERDGEKKTRSPRKGFRSPRAPVKDDKEEKKKKDDKQK